MAHMYLIANTQALLILDPILNEPVLEFSEVGALNIVFSVIWYSMSSWLVI